MSASNEWVFHPDDYAPAAMACRFFMTEAHTWEECYDLVVKPTEDLLWRFAASRPENLICANSLALTDKVDLPRDRADILIVLPGPKVVYLGRVFTPTTAKSPEIKRNRYGIAIPVTDTVLTSSSCEEGVRKYLWIICPPLSGLPIEWLPDTASSALCEEIELEALARKRQQMDHEVDRILDEDEGRI